MGSLFGGGAKNTWAQATIAQQGAAQQAAANREAAIAGTELSMVDQITPDGSLTYSWVGNSPAGNPRYQATQTLDPTSAAARQMEKNVDLTSNTLANQQLNRAANTLGTNVDFSDAAINAKVQSMINPRLAQRFDQDENTLRTSLINRGVREGSQAFNDAMLSFNQGKNDAYTQEALANRQQALQEIPLGRNQILNEISALANGQQVNLPQFVNTPRATVQAADYQGAAAQQIAALQAMQQAKTAKMGGLFNLGGAIIGAVGNAAKAASDRRVKTDVRRVGELPNGLPLYLFRYVGGGPTILGLMAQDVEKVLPSAVEEIGGIKHVDYAQAVGWEGAQ